MAAKSKKFSRKKASSLSEKDSADAGADGSGQATQTASAAAAATSATFAATTNLESGRQELTGNEQVAAQQFAARSGRQPSVERDDIEDPTVGSPTPERTVPGSDAPPDPSALGRTVFEDMADGTDDTSPEAAEALSVFEQMTSGGRPGVGGFDNRLADLVRPGSDDNRNDYDGSRTTPTSDDISTVFRVDYVNDPAVVLPGVEQRRMAAFNAGEVVVVSAAGDMFWRNEDGTYSSLNGETGTVTTKKTTETGSVTTETTASGLPPEDAEIIVIDEEPDLGEALTTVWQSLFGQESGPGGIGDDIPPQERMKLAEYLRAQMGTEGGYRGGGEVDPNEHDDGRGTGTGSYTSPRDRLLGDGEEVTGGPAEGEVGGKFDRVAGGQGGAINWGETGNGPAQEQGLTEDVPAYVGREGDLSHLFEAGSTDSSNTSRLAPRGGDTSRARYSDDDDDDDHSHGSEAE